MLCGTDLHIAQACMPKVISAEMCCLGWQESLMHLAVLVEPEIAGEQCKLDDFWNLDRYGNWGQVRQAFIAWYILLMRQQGRNA